ncbi:MAG: hypothetical protein KA885_08865 [Spirochaetes bacterium]|nr:hypothetical protein [Spirochaetota bacterium]
MIIIEVVERLVADNLNENDKKIVKKVLNLVILKNQIQTLINSFYFSDENYERN